MLTFVILIVGTISLVLYYLHNFIKNKSNYWSNKGFVSLGNNISTWDVISGKKDIIDSDLEYYQKLGELDEKVGVVMEMGVFGTPILIVRDLDVAKDIFIKDFDHFFDRRGFGKFDKLISDSLFALEGQDWKDMRTFLTPAFTSGRIKRIFEHFERSAKNLNTFVKSNPTISGTGFDIPVADTMRRFTIEVIGTAAFGMDPTSLQNQELHEMAEKVGTFSMSRKIRIFLLQQLPTLTGLLGIKGMDSDVSDFFWGLISSSLKDRQEGGVQGNDFLQMLVDAQNGALKEDKDDVLSREENEARLKSKSGGNKNNIKWSNDVAVPQGFIFMFAGLDTVANNLSIAMYILAMRVDIQEKIFEEVCAVLKEDGETISYEDVNKLVYLDMFISEVLRLYPAVSRLDRKCMKDYTISAKEGGKSTVIPKGTIIVIPAEAIQRDEQYYPDPLKIDPERFSVENKAKRNPYAYMPFGIGPRNCIGMRFALVETKVALAHIVRNFIIGPTETTPIPERITKAFFGYRVASKVELRLMPRV